MSTDTQIEYVTSNNLAIIVVHTTYSIGTSQVHIHRFKNLNTVSCVYDDNSQVITN